MSDDIQTFFEGARLVSQKNFTTQTRYTHNTYIYIVTQKLEHISWHGFVEVSLINYLEITWKIYILYDSFNLLKR
jgi:hypothetical protein